MKTPPVWLASFTNGDVRSEDGALAIRTALAAAGVVVHPVMLPERDLSGPGLVLLQHVDDNARALLREVSARDGTRTLILCVDPRGLPAADVWELLGLGADDVLTWQAPSITGAAVAARLGRWQEVDAVLHSAAVQARLVGASAAWRAVLRRIIEIALYTDDPVLISGETGTGKELAARFIHSLDLRRSHKELVLLDCTTIVPDLAGSELFGHERGAFTGAAATRDGVFAQADGSTLFLDEIGELSAGLQVQLLRVLQEHTYKRVGSNVWQRSDFRLIGATNRDLYADEARGVFRRDLLYRIARWEVTLPPLRERREDIVPLAQHFIRRSRPDAAVPEFDAAVCEYLTAREYKGNVRDLENLIARVMARHVEPGPITIGDIPGDERPHTVGSASDDGCDFEDAAQAALARGATLGAIRTAAGDAAIRIAVAEAHGVLAQAAQRLGVTPRTVQAWYAEQRRSPATD